MDTKVFLSVGPMRKAERIIPSWKNKIVNAAIQNGDEIELVPSGG